MRKKHEKLPSTGNKFNNFDHGGGGGGGGGQGSGPPLKNHKTIGFLSNTGPDPLKNH